MTHNALSRSMSIIPMWVLQAILGIVLSGGVAWTTWATVTANRHESAIAVAEAKVDAVKDDISEIKGTQRTMDGKLDRLLERQAQPHTHGR